MNVLWVDNGRKINSLWSGWLWSECWSIRLRCGATNFELLVGHLKSRRIRQSRRKTIAWRATIYDVYYWEKSMMIQNRTIKHDDWLSERMELKLKLLFIWTSLDARTARPKELVERIKKIKTSIFANSLNRSVDWRSKANRMLIECWSNAADPVHRWFHNLRGRWFIGRSFDEIERRWLLANAEQFEQFETASVNTGHSDRCVCVDGLRAKHA